MKLTNMLKIDRNLKISFRTNKLNNLINNKIQMAKRKFEN
jgi:hypothetical protein